MNVLPTRRRSSAEIRSNWRLRRSACGRVAGRELEAAIPVLPVAPGAFDGGAHAASCSAVRAAAVGGKRLRDLGENELSDAVARLRERERDVGVEALELRRVARAADPRVERRAVIGSRAAAGELAPDAAAAERSRQRGRRSDRGSPRRRRSSARRLRPPRAGRRPPPGDGR